MAFETKPCILCGKPRVPHAYKYCETCRKKMDARGNRRRRMQYYHQAADGKSKPKPGRPASKKPTSKELEAEACAKSSNGWTTADIVDCKGCTYWRNLSYTKACYYPIDTGRLRPCDPKDCYKQEGTPYKKRGG